MVDVSGQPFARRVTLFGDELLLNGTGLRQVAWFKGYAIGLYLRERATTAEQVVDVPGAKRLQLRMFVEVPAKEFAKAFDKGVARNTDAAALAPLAARMDTFRRMILDAAKVRINDVVDLDFEPARGMHFAINGRSQGAPIPGADFYGALLRAFVGGRPYDDKMRIGLLRGSAGG